MYSSIYFLYTSKYLYLYFLYFFQFIEKKRVNYISYFSLFREKTFSGLWTPEAFAFPGPNLRFVLFSEEEESLESNESQNKKILYFLF